MQTDPIVVLEGGKPRIVAEGIYFANGVAIDPEERFIYVAETMQRRIIRFRIGQDGSLGPMEVYGPGSLGKLGFRTGSPSMRRKISGSPFPPGTRSA